jgi:hypothetical protein
MQSIPTQPEIGKSGELANRALATADSALVNPGPDFESIGQTIGQRF